MPLVPAGFALFSASISASEVRLQLLRAWNDARPIVHWTMPPLSVRYCTWPALRVLHRRDTTSAVTVPTFGFGIRPRGPRIWPSWPTTRIASGDGDHHVEIHEAFLDLRRRGRRSRRCRRRLPCAAFALSPCANTATRTFLPGARRQHDRAAHGLVGLLRVDAEVDRDVDRFVELGDRGFLDELQRLVDRVRLGVIDLAAHRLHALRELGMSSVRRP